MTTEKFQREEWVEKLALVLSSLADTQEYYQDELHQQQRNRVRAEVRVDGGMSRPLTPHHPSENLSVFYMQACLGKGQYFQEHYGPLRAALASVRTVLATHPAWESIVDPCNDNDEYWTQIVSRGSLDNLAKVISGLMARAIEVRENGFRVASAELSALLEPDKVPEQALYSGSLSVGYHVVLFYGLHVNREIQLSDDIAIMPFEKLDAFVNSRVLENVAPNIIKYNRWKSVGAIVKPFRWKPEFRKRGEDSHLNLDWDSSFFDDAQVLVELLATFHAAPVIFLVRIPFCIHRTASHLLGHGNDHGGYTWGISARTFDIHSGSSEMSQLALDNIRIFFENRKNDRFKNCASVIARLAEALARSGRFQSDDKILDVAIALERIYELDGGEISFKLKTRAASFLEFCPQTTFAGVP